jgi:hypothetical protein
MRTAIFLFTFWARMLTLREDALHGREEPESGNLTMDFTGPEVRDFGNWLICFVFFSTIS